MATKKKPRVDDFRNRKSDEKNAVEVDVKDDMSDPVKGLPKAKG